MEKNALKAVRREIKSDGDLRSLREKGFVPGVLYGRGSKPVPLAVEAKPFAKLLQTTGKNALLTLEIGASHESALVKVVQRDVIKRDILHVDFQRVVMSEKIEVSVPVHTVGEAPGVKLHEGILEHLLREIKVRCLPSKIPQVIEVDVSALEIGQSIVVRDLKRIEDVEFLTDSAQIVVNVVTPQAEEEVAPVESAAAAPGATAAEPEVIAKGKKEEEGAVAEGDAKKAAGSDAKKAPAGDAKKPEAAKGEAKKPEQKK